MVDSLEDFHQKYNHTWIRYIGKDGISPAYVDMVSFEDICVYLRSQDEGVVSVNYTDKQFEKKIDLSTPPTGYFNYNGHALVLFKKPNRQWRKGLCEDNHEIYNPFKKLLHEGAYKPSFGSKTVKFLFEPAYVSNPEEAQEKFGKNVHSVALSRHLMVSKSPLEHTSTPLVWFGCNPVGFIHNRRFVIEDDIFQQEVEDELRTIGQEAWIF